MQPPRILMKCTLVPSSVPGELDVLAAPYGGPNAGRDSHQQYFSPETNFQESLIPLPPVFYNHGENIQVAIGVTLRRWVDARGVWYHVKLDLAIPEAGRCWDAAQQGNCYASSGVVPASYAADDSGLITSWLIGEITLIDADPAENREPANYYAIALPRAKSLLAAHGITERHLFSNVYIQEKSTMLEKMKALLQQMLGVLDEAAEGKPAAESAVEDAADAIEDAIDEIADGDGDGDGDGDLFDGDGDGEYMEKCASCGGSCGDGVDDDGDMSTWKGKGKSKAKAKARAVATKTRTVNPQIAEMQKTIRRMESEAAARDHAAWVAQQIRAGKLLPAERESLIASLGQAYRADALTKSAGGGMVKSIMKMIESRPAVAPVNAGDLSIAGFDGNKGQDEINDEYMARLRSYVGAAK